MEAASGAVEPLRLARAFDSFPVKLVGTIVLSSDSRRDLAAFSNLAKSLERGGARALYQIKRYRAACLIAPEKGSCPNVTAPPGSGIKSRKHRHRYL